MAGPTETTASEEGAGTTITLVLFALALLGFAGWMGWECYVALASAGWPTTEGVVTQRKMFEHVKVGGSSGSPSNSVSIELSYTYSVNGVDYTGTTFNTRNNFVPKESAPAVAEKYRTGAKCTVHYNPRSPAVALLDTAVEWNTWVKLALAVGSLLGGLVVAYLALPTRRPAPPEG